MANLAEGGITITSNCKNLFIDLKEKILNNPDFSYESGPSFSDWDDGSMNIHFCVRWTCCSAFGFIDSLMADEQYIYRQELIDAEISGWQDQSSNLVFAWYRKAPGEVTIMDIDLYEVLALESDNDFWGTMRFIFPKLPAPGKALVFSSDFRINVFSKYEISPKLTLYTLLINYEKYDIKCTFTHDDNGIIEGEYFGEIYNEKFRDERNKMPAEVYKSEPGPGFYVFRGKSIYLTYDDVVHNPEESYSVRHIIRVILYFFSVRTKTII